MYLGTIVPCVIVRKMNIENIISLFIFIYKWDGDMLHHIPTGLTAGITRP